jgi:hypothetical protein
MKNMVVIGLFFLSNYSFAQTDGVVTKLREIGLKSYICSLRLTGDNRMDQLFEQILAAEERSATKDCLNRVHGELVFKDGLGKIALQKAGIPYFVDSIKVIEIRRE